MWGNHVSLSPSLWRSSAFKILFIDIFLSFFISMAVTPCRLPVSYSTEARWAVREQLIFSSLFSLDRKKRDAECRRESYRRRALLLHTPTGLGAKFSRSLLLFIFRWSERHLAWAMSGQRRSFQQADELSSRLGHNAYVRRFIYIFFPSLFPRTRYGRMYTLAR